MGTEEYIGHLTVVDQDGKKQVLYPRTKVEAVEGLFDGDNDLASEYCQAFGDGNTIGLLGYYITEIDANSDGSGFITLSMKQDVTDTTGMKLTWSPNDRVSMVDTSTYYINCAKITSVAGNKIGLDKLPFTALTEIEGSNAFLHSVVCHNNPLAGQIDLGQNSTAFGVANTVNNRDSLAVGSSNKISPSAGFAYAMGKQNKVTGSTATAIGYNNTASGENAIAQGMSTTASGLASTATGSATTASGSYSRAGGFLSKASGNYSDATGQRTEATGPSSHATGNRSKAIGETSSAHNYATEAQGKNSFATGSSTKAIGEMSFTGGDKTVARGKGSVAFGLESEATGNYGAAFGKNTKSGENALSAGQESEATGRSSAAVGYKAKAPNECSAAFGRNVIAAGVDQMAVGRYNANDEADRFARFVVGIGQDADNRATGFRVTENGDSDLNGHRLLNAANVPVDAVLGTGQDLNKVVKSGMYRLGATVVNGLPEFNYGQMLVIRGGGKDDTITQLAFPFSQSRMWLRSGNSDDVDGGGSWTAWKEIGAGSVDYAATAGSVSWYNITDQPQHYMVFSIREVYSTPTDTTTLNMIDPYAPLRPLTQFFYVGYVVKDHNNETVYGTVIFSMEELLRANGSAIKKFAPVFSENGILTYSTMCAKYDPLGDKVTIWTADKTSSGQTAKIAYVEGYA